MQEADYIVVMDTGSTDDTVEILKSDPRVTRVEVQEIKPWRFDVARNESMKLVPEDADILVCTDFDEVFDPGWASALKDAWKNGVNRVHYTYAWSHTPSGDPTDIFVYDKIHTKDYYWKFAVHEVLWRDDYENEVCVDVGEKIYLHHYQDKSKERCSYFDLLKLSVEEYPDDSHVRMLLAREYLLKDDLNNALNEYLTVLKMSDVEKPEKRLVLLESLGRCADIYMYLGNFDEAIWYAQEFIKEDHTYREPYLTLAKVYNQMGMFTLAEAMVNLAIKYGTKKNTWVERADTWTYLPHEQLGLAHYNLGRVDEAITESIQALKYFPKDAQLLEEQNTYLRKKLKLNSN